MNLMELWPPVSHFPGAKVDIASCKNPIEIGKKVKRAFCASPPLNLLA